MTVAELMTILQKYDPDMLVLHQVAGSDGHYIESIDMIWSGWSDPENVPQLGTKKPTDTFVPDALAEVVFATEQRKGRTKRTLMLI